MMPPMKVTQRAAPQAVEKQRRWASFRKGDSLDELRPSDFDPNVSGENITPMAKKATAARNLVSQAISLLLWPHALRLTVVEAWHLMEKLVGSLYLFIYQRTYKSPPASIEVIYSNVGYLLYRRIILTYVQVTENAISTLGDLRSTCACVIHTKLQIQPATSVRSSLHLSYWAFACFASFSYRSQHSHWTCRVSLVSSSKWRFGKQ